MATYRIVRFFHPSTKKEKEVIEEGLTLEDAKEHCTNPFTKTLESFDGYEEEQ